MVRIKKDPSLRRIYLFKAGGMGEIKTRYRVVAIAKHDIADKIDESFSAGRAK